MNKKKCDWWGFFSAIQCPGVCQICWLVQSVLDGPLPLLGTKGKGEKRVNWLKAGVTFRKVVAARPKPRFLLHAGVLLQNLAQSFRHDQAGWGVGAIDEEPF